ncbi:MAG: twin-arginine translocase subunit TatC [Chlorobi bacterium]|nr:twin-arginine translocase subunit TatC [Chlorobiota bacterium]
MGEEQKKEMSFLDHLEELRWHLIRSFIAIFVFAVLAFIFKEFVFDEIILAPSTPDFFTNRFLCNLANQFSMPSLCINQTPLTLQNINMSGQFTTHIWVSFIAGVIAAFPYIFWEIWSFIKPALYPDELRHSRGAIFFTSLLFITGILFSYYIICPLSVQFLGNYQVSSQVENIVNLGSYISTITSIVLAGGIIFELPVFIFFLAKAGLVTADFLKTYRRHAIVVALLLAAIITPPDIVSQILVCLPLIVLYEAGIVIAKHIEKNREEESKN